MKDKAITIKAYQAKCEFCEGTFTELKPTIAETKRNQHMYNDCPVLKCICLIKGVKYPISQISEAGKIKKQEVSDESAPAQSTRH